MSGERPRETPRTSADPATARGKLNLRLEHRRRSRPALFVAFLLMATSAPAAHHIVQASALRKEGDALAAELARTLAREVRRRPELWHYDSPKVLQELRRHRGEGLHLRIDDAAGRTVASLGENRGAMLWSQRPVQHRGNDAGTVWLGQPLAPLRQTTALLFGIFVLLGAALAALLRTLSDRALRQSEGQVRELLNTLEELNSGLEQQVASRLSEIEDKNATLRKQERRLRDLSAKAIAAQEAQRRSIGRDLHDGVGQALTAIRIQLELLRQRHPDDPNVPSAVALLDATLDEVRRALRSLGPAVVAEVGLAVALCRLVEAIAQTPTGPKLVAEVEAQLPELTAALEINAYRIAQEALHNALRHAQASTITLRLQVSKSELIVQVIDDGVGLQSGDKSTGEGLEGIRERAELLGGSVTTEAASPKATTGPGFVLTARLPLPRDTVEA